MSTIKTDKIIPVGSALTVEGASVFTAGVSANSTLSVGGSVYAAANVYASANVYATGGTVVMSSAYTHRNRIINGDMRVNQRGATGATFGGVITVTKNYDMWYMNRTTGNTFSYVGGVTTGGATLPGHRQYLRVTTPATTKALVNTDYGSIYQPIEGSNVDDLLYGTAAARTTTLSFWVRSSVTGTFSGKLASYPIGDRSYVYPYTINAANTWEYKTVTIPGDTGGTWATGANGQIFIVWNMGSGSNYGSATNLEWNAQNQFFITGSTQLVSTANATWDITGVQWELGSVATPFEYRPFSVELAMCQRYYQNYRIDKVPLNTSLTSAAWAAAGGVVANGDAAKSFYIVGAHSSGYGESLMGVLLPVEMRATPSIGGRGMVASSAFTNATTGFNGSTVVTNGYGQVGTKSIQWINIGTDAGAFTSGQYLGFDLSAEL